MKILIEESVLRQALEAIGAALSDDKPYLNKCRSSYAAIESALDTVETVESFYRAAYNARHEGLDAAGGQSRSME